jgi:hypothetical protein
LSERTGIWDWPTRTTPTGAIETEWRVIPHPASTRATTAIANKRTAMGRNSRYFFATTM